MGDRSPGRRSIELLGREAEREALDSLVDAVRGGESRALVLVGDAGVGKSALLDHVAARAAGCRVIRASGVQSEMELPFAGLHQVCAPALDHLDRLPPPQAEALSVVFGMAPGAVPDPFLVGLAVLNLLSDVAEEQPLICLIDDEHWMDRASSKVLFFVARRLGADSVGLILVQRASHVEPGGLSTLVVEGLDQPHARALLETVVDWPLDRQVGDRLVAETRGNPLALLELAPALSPARSAGGFALPTAVPLSNTIEASFEGQLVALPDATRRLIQLAAADPVGDPLLLWTAAGNLGISVEAATPAVEAGLVEIGPHVRFRHPLVRSAAYRSASLDERHRLHRALADATDPQIDPDREAWHRAEAAAGPDEDVATELERSAARAQARGGLAAAAAFLERAALLTPQPQARARRSLAAAWAKHDAGALDEALTLLDAAEGSSLDERAAAEAERLRGRIAIEQGRFGDAAALLLSTALRLEPLDPAEAREVHLEALQTAIWLDDVGRPKGMRTAAEAGRAAPPASDPPRLVDVLVDAWAIRLTEGHTAAAPVFADALGRVRRLSAGSDPDRAFMAAAGIDTTAVALELWDADTWFALAPRQVQLARNSGATVQLQFALNTLAWTQILQGDLGQASRSLDEDRMIAEATGNPPQVWTDPVLAAWRGHDAAPAAIEAFTGLASQIGFGAWISVARYARSVYGNGTGRHDDAHDSALPAFERETTAYPLLVYELAEAASRIGDAATLAALADAMSERVPTAANDWASGTDALVRALLDDGDSAEALYRDAIVRLGRSGMRAHLARTHLLYGEWLRRRRRRTDARETLRLAYEALSEMGIEAFAERARRELMATGVTAIKRTVETSQVLTPQETLIAGLARDGLTNPEIGGRLFISARTVKYHLSKVYTKLGITSREQLDGVLPVGSATSGPASTS